MFALVDLDILCYEMGSAADEEGLPLSWPLVQSRVDARIEQILEAVDADGWQGFLTGPGNFRDEVATILPYKGHRKRSERPYWYQGVYQYLQYERGAEVVTGREADDLIVQLGHDNPDAVMCSRDKDLMQAPGWHYMWKFHNSKDSEYIDLPKRFWPSLKKAEQLPIFVDTLHGFRFFCSQLVCGDSADNIPGLYRQGPRSAAIDKLLKAQTELEAFIIVKDLYELYFGSYWDMFMCENGRLLWLKRDEDDDWYRRQRRYTEQCSSLPDTL